MKNHILLLLCLVQTAWLAAQNLPLSYYLPDVPYNKAIPTPQQFLGWQIGDWHISHDLQLAYMRALDAASDRITLTEYARTHEQRPLVYLTITSPANHARLPEIQAQHLALCTPDKAPANVDNLPVVLYQGFSIHGNEPSGGNAAVLVAYYLAAAEDARVQELLNNAVVLLDPCFNPDGFQRFSTWANIHKNLNLTPDPSDREYSEVWPGGRTNHYWFDLNRDWLPLQHPETRGRMATFHAWRPNILTDHHEMGTNSTFFFMPGEPTRVNPLTPKINQELTAKIGEFHAQALDGIGALYYSREGYDDFFYGKGSTYPDIHGCVGILFEQGSSRGHLQDTENGLLSFPYTIRNQVTTALSTHSAALGLRKELLTYQREYWKEVAREAAAERRYGYVFGNDGDPVRTHDFIAMLQRHQVQVYPLNSTIKANGQTFEAGQSFAIPFNQPQYRFVKAIFDPVKTFEDSIFYDISTWVMPMAFNLPVATLDAKPNVGALLTAAPTVASNAVEMSDYGYLLSWEHLSAPKLAYQLMNKGLRLKVATSPFAIDGKDFPRGTLLLPVERQTLSPTEIHALLGELTGKIPSAVHPLSSGNTPEGPDLGSDFFAVLRQPKIALLVGDGVTSYEAGALWHLLDQRFGIPVTKLSTDQFGRADLSKYTVIIMPGGNYTRLTPMAESLRSWVNSGGVLIAQKGANNWCAAQKLCNVQFKELPKDSAAQYAYGDMENIQGGRVLGGAIFEAKGDLSHPLLFGFRRDALPCFHKDNLFFKPATNPYATPLRYSEAPWLSGYIHKDGLSAISGSGAVVVSALNKGRVISLSFESSFRAFWLGSSKLVANGVFFGHIIQQAACETAG